jgi:dihydrofolate reductase
MQIRALMSMSADGYVTTPSGWPSLTADPAFVSGESHGIREFLADCEAALMGRVTFEPALTNERWPWPNLDVFVLASHRPPGTPETRLAFERERGLPGGSVEIVYAVGDIDGATGSSLR